MRLKEMSDEGRMRLEEEEEEERRIAGHGGWG